MSIHIRPTAALAERVVLPEDPGVAMALAQMLLERPLMFNHNRGLWGYTGAAAADGRPLTVQSTGMGGPSAAIVFAELVALGLQRAVRVGSCGGLDERLELGQLVIADAALSADGTSRALGAGPRVDGVEALTAGLLAAAPEVRHGLVASTDIFYGTGGSTGQRRSTEPCAAWLAAGALAVDMETAALFALGARLAVPVACILVVTDLSGPPPRRIGDHDEAEAAGRAGRLAAAVLD